MSNQITITITVDNSLKANESTTTRCVFYVQTRCEISCLSFATLLSIKIHYIILIPLEEHTFCFLFGVMSFYNISIACFVTKNPPYLLS